MRLRPRVPFVAPKHYVKLIGFITAEDSNATRVAIYRGSSATPFASVPVHVTADGTGVFSVKVKLGTSTTSFKAVWEAPTRTSAPPPPARCASCTEERRRLKRRGGRGRKRPRPPRLLL